MFACLILAVLHLTAQESLNDGTKLLFGETVTKLTAADKATLFKRLGLRWSRDKNAFVDKSDVDESMPYEHVQCFPTDLNKDGKEEIFFMLTNPALYGMTGTAIMLFTKNTGNAYALSCNIPAADIIPLSTKHLNYPDILLSLPGMDYIVWRWNGKSYNNYKKLTGKQLPKDLSMGLPETSKAYQAGLKK